MASKLTPSEIQNAVQDLDTLCIQEYDDYFDGGLTALLLDPDKDRAAARLQRITGIVLKRKFARSHAIGKGTSSTKADRRWEWVPEKIANADRSAPEYIVLDELRKALPRFYSYRKDTFQDLIGEAETERGLYKILTLWIIDKWNAQETKSIREYLAQEESAEFKTILDIADFVSQQALTVALASLVPHTEVVVALTIIAGAYGYERISKAPDKRDHGS